MKKQKTDNDRESINFKELIQMLKLFLPKYTVAIARIKKFTDFDVKKINKLTGKDVKGIILDVDGTIAPDRHKILTQNIKHIKKLQKEGLKIVIFSNMNYSNRYEDLDNSIPVLTHIPAKPDPKGFLMALDIIDLNKKNVLMVGDNYITDGGSIQVGIDYLNVLPVPHAVEPLSQRLRYFMPRNLRSFYNLVARFHDLFRRKKTPELK